MGKYKSTFMAEIREEEIFKEEQESLKKKHKIDDDDVIVVEKRGIFKFLIRLGIAAIKLIVSIVIIAFASIGVITVIYPVPRAEFITVILSILDEVYRMVGII